MNSHASVPARCLGFSPLPLWERMPEGQERGRERNDARFGSSSLDMTFQFIGKCSGSLSPGLRPPSPIKGEGKQIRFSP
jgi:hypothetical protein